MIWASDHKLRWVWLGLQLFLGVLFCYAGVSKLIDPLRFSSSLLGYQILPMVMIRPLVFAIP